MRIEAEDERAVAELLAEGGIGADDAPVIGVHVGSGPNFYRVPLKRWPVESFVELCDALVERYGARISSPEITLEANPDDLSGEKLRELKNSGINRLSIGIQSFNNNILHLLNRTHTAKVGIQAFVNARNAGYSNISIDLMYAIPNQNTLEWEENIEKAIDLDPEHISAYTLTIESNTVFGRQAMKGKLDYVSDETAATQMEILMNKLESSGYEHYEVSNFSKPNFHSNHNRNYWCQEKYLGIGPSAHSYDGVSRQFNVRNNHLYLQSLHNGKVPFEREVLSVHDKINEYILTSLRTNTGCNLKKLKAEFSFDLFARHMEFIQQLIKQNMAILDNEMLALTRTGRMLADKIASDLFETNPKE
jgi:oxygen-independent coproporphyrinogen-3 oxidase